MQARVREPFDLVDIVVSQQLAGAQGRQLVRAFQPADCLGGQGLVLRIERGMGLVADARPDLQLILGELPPFKLDRHRHRGGGQRNQLVGNLQIVVLQQRLVDLLRELRLVLGVRLHRVEVLGPFGKRRVQRIGAGIDRRIGVVPNLAAPRGEAGRGERENQCRPGSHGRKYNRTRSNKRKQHGIPGRKTHPDHRAAQQPIDRLGYCQGGAARGRGTRPHLPDRAVQRPRHRHGEGTGRRDSASARSHR